MHARSALTALLACLAVIASGCDVGDLTGRHGWDFSDTLPEVVDDFGKDARVIYVLDRAGNVTFVVLGSDGRVHERDYRLVCTGGGAGSRNGQSCSKKTENKTRAPLRGERDTARVRLGELDSGIVDHLRDKTDAYSGAPVGLRGRRWAVAPAVFKGYVADLDGSNLHRAESPADRAFANSVSPGAGARNPNDKGGSATGPPPDVPAPPGQLAEGRPDFAAFAEAIHAMRAKVAGRRAVLVAVVDDGIVSFEYIAPSRYVYKVKWDPMERKLVDAGHPFSNGTEPPFALSKLNAARIEQIARRVATKEHAEKLPGVLIKVLGTGLTASMIVQTPTGGKAYDVPLG